MGHTAGKDIYRQLGAKIDSLATRTPWNEALYAILRELYSPEEAELVAGMPHGLSTFDRLETVSPFQGTRLRALLDRLCAKGLIVDLWLRDDYHYAPSPMVIGIFEFTMMRTGGNLNTKKWAELFHSYMLGDDSFFAANFKNNEQIGIMRALPHEESILPADFVEVLDYEKATALVEEADKFSVGLCSCRHEKFHIGKKACDVPLDTCSSFGHAAEYLIRNNLAGEVSKAAMLDNIARSKELGLVLNADNVKKNITFICHCCKCCCNALAGISKFGYANTVVTSSFIAEIDMDTCTGCGKCAKACAVDCIDMVSSGNTALKTKQYPRIDAAFCLGCGVCGVRCPSGAIRLVKRGQRVIHPESTFEKVILGALERGTLHNQLFDNPHSASQKFLRGLVGAFCKLPPVKKALMSDMLRSTFLKTIKLGAAMQGKGWLTEL